MPAGPLDVLVDLLAIQIGRQRRWWQRWRAWRSSLPAFPLQEFAAHGKAKANEDSVSIFWCAEHEARLRIRGGAQQEDAKVPPHPLRRLHEEASRPLRFRRGEVRVGKLG